MGFSLVAASEGFSCCRARALGAWASVVVACGLSSCGSRALECRLSSCGAWTELLCSMWDLPGPGLEPMTPALIGRRILFFLFFFVFLFFLIMVWFYRFFFFF